MTDFAALSGPELVREYNRLASARGLPTVKRFATNAAGRTRCSRLMDASTPPPIRGSQIELFEEFNTSTRRLRGKLLKAFTDNINAQVTLNQLIRAVYGSINLERRGALLMVLRGLMGTVKKKRLPYQIRKSKTETGVVSYGFYQA